MKHSRLYRLAIERGLLLGALVLVTYLVLAPSHIVAADNAEFSTLAALGGRAHPSGYPLYVLYLRAMSWLPGSPAHAASLATALLGALTIVVLHAACRAWGARPTSATIAAALFASAPVVLRVHTEADVFALNSLLAASILLVAAPASPLQGVRRAAVLGLLAGLALSNNLTAALLAPIGIYGLACGAREGRTSIAIASALGMACVGLVPYVYLFEAPDLASWAPVHSLGDLLDTFLRKDYGYASHVGSGASVSAMTSLVAHAELVARVWLWLPAFGAIAMLGARCVRGDARWAWSVLALSWLLCGPLLASRLGIATHGIGAYIGGRMEILSCLVLAIPAAAAFDWVAARVPRSISPVTSSALACAGFVVLVAAAWPKLARVHGSAVEDGVENMLAAAPPGAVVIVESEDLCFGARYEQLAKGERDDETVVCAALLTRPWYRARLPLAFPPSPTPMPTIDDANAALAAHRPLLVEPGLRPILDALPSYPVGTLREVVPPEQQRPSAIAELAEERDVFSRFALASTRPDSDDDFASVAFQRYAATWAAVARDLQRAGDQPDASAALQLAHELRPQ